MTLGMGGRRGGWWWSCSGVVGMSSLLLQPVVAVRCDYVPWFGVALGLGALVSLLE